MKAIYGYAILVAALLILDCSQEEPGPGQSDALAGATQMILVVTPDEISPAGELARFERARGGEWQAVGAKIPAVIGKNGLGWGIGEHPLPAAAVMKQEGDGKSPAGIFRLSFIFGFAPAGQMVNLQMPYVHVSETLECVDDGTSSLYNRVVDRRTVDQVDWNSSEKMRAVGEPYYLGVMVEHNSAQQSGAGSCIFLHIWSGLESPTVGCTAVERPNMEKIVAWLDPSAHPLLVQLTRADYDQLKSGWQLPSI